MSKQNDLIPACEDKSFETTQSEIITALSRNNDNVPFNRHCEWLQSKGYIIHCIVSDEFGGDDQYKVSVK